MNFGKAIENLKNACCADGRIDLDETGAILRFVKPYALNGNEDAVALEQLLHHVRADGVITEEESAQVIDTLERISSSNRKLAEFVRVIPDFPKPGILFRDVTGILDTAEGFNMALDEISEALKDVRFDIVAAPESRGFIFGAAIASRFGKAFVPVRKPGKLPRKTIHEAYELEYGTAELHMHADAVIPGERAIIVDDLLATGGTAAAAARLVERLGGKVVKMIFPIELEGFKARENQLKGYSVASLVRYPGK